VAHPKLQQTYRFVSTIYNFFHRSHRWSHRLYKWGQENGKRHFLTKYGDTRFYTIIKMFKTVKEYQNGIGMLVESPDAIKPLAEGGIDLETRQTSTSSREFTNLEEAIAVLQPITDFIADMESHHATAADVELGMAKMIGAICQKPVQDDDLRQHITNCVNLFTKAQSTSLTKLALFLVPAAKQFALSKGGKFDQLHDNALRYAAKWRLITNSPEGSSLSRELNAYREGIEEYSLAKGILELH
jgi:hypothetical protein